MKLNNLLLLSVATMAATSVVPGQHVLKDLALDSSHETSEHLSVENQVPGPMGADILSDGDGDGDGVTSLPNALSQAIEHWQMKAPTVPTDSWLRAFFGEHVQLESTRSNKTVYQLIAESKHTTMFARLIHQHEEIIPYFNGTAANFENVTVFVPIDSAMESAMEFMRGMGIELSQQDEREILAYHFSSLFCPAEKLPVTHTLPSTLRSVDLGGQLQRLSITFDEGRMMLNHHSRIIAADIFGTNGVIHVLETILCPPVGFAYRSSSVSDKHSIYKNGLASTGLDIVLQDTSARMGGTFFMPSNAAFEQLGPTVNDFLFSSPDGLKYLRALLSYHVVPDHTLYSDAYWNISVTPYIYEGAGHLDLPTLVKDQSLSIDVFDFGDFSVFMRIGGLYMQMKDVIVWDGVIQPIDEILFPPNPGAAAEEFLPPRPGQELTSREMTVETLIERLEPLIGGLAELEEKINSLQAQAQAQDPA